MVQFIVFVTCYRGYWTVERPRQQPNYHAVRRSCRERGALFEDPDFPAGPKCLYKNKRPAIQPIVWMRPHVSIVLSAYQFIFKHRLKIKIKIINRVAKCQRSWASV